MATALHDSAVVMMHKGYSYNSGEVLQCNYGKPLTEFLGTIMSSHNAIDGEPLTDVLEPQ